MSMKLRQLGHRLGALVLVAAIALAPTRAAPPRSTAPVTVNFVNADIDAVSRAMAAMIGRQILVDPRVKGTITLYSEEPQSVAEAYQSFQTALRGLGFAIVESGGLLKLVPEADAKLQTGTVSIGNVGVHGDQVITQIFQLRYENPNSLVAVLRPLISANNTINANPTSNSLVITDYADNLKRIAQIIAALDQPEGTGVDVVPLQHAVALDLAPLVQKLVEGGGGGRVVGGQSVSVGGLRGGGTSIIADPQTNSLIVKAPNAAQLADINATIARLDRPNSLAGPGDGMWVVRLKNADATRLATVVRAAFAAISESGGGTTGGARGGVAAAPAPAAAPVQTPTVTGSNGAVSGGLATAAQPSTGGFIQADPATNSLVITAPEPLYRQVRALIDQLDTRRAQVYIESLIVEVSGSRAADFGFQWQGLLGKSGDKFGIAAGTNFTSSSGTGNIINLQTGAVQGQINLNQGLNIGLLRAYNGATTLAAIAQALETQGQTNIISTPNLITLDNEEAKIVVGENVPFITGQFTQTGGAATNPFQTIERKDVGITLRIRPQIGENGAIRMTIFQEQSAVEPTTAAGTSNAGPSTTKRSIEGTVTVDDGQILVLGGLIQDNVSVTQSKVPLLGDLPVIGSLFRSESRQHNRTNLMVFLRPVVMRDAAESAAFSRKRYDQMRGAQERTQPTPSVVMPVNRAPVLPAAPMPPPAASAASAPVADPLVAPATAERELAPAD
jgi:general secretion pathway protein D